MTDNQIILPLEEEATNLELHTKLCAQRYQQLIGKLDTVDTRLDRLEVYIIDIKDALKNDDAKKYKTYLSWAGMAITVIIGASATIIARLLVH